MRQQELKLELTVRDALKKSWIFGPAGTEHGVVSLKHVRLNMIKSNTELKNNNQ